MCLTGTLRAYVPPAPPTTGRRCLCVCSAAAVAPCHFAEQHSTAAPLQRPSRLPQPQQLELPGKQATPTATTASLLLAAGCDGSRARGWGFAHCAHIFSNARTPSAPSSRSYSCHTHAVKADSDLQTFRAPFSRPRWLAAGVATCIKSLHTTSLLGRSGWNGRTSPAKPRSLEPPSARVGPGRRQIGTSLTTVCEEVCCSERRVGGGRDGLARQHTPPF
jgi:hypothetical protein